MRSRAEGRSRTGGEIRGKRRSRGLVRRRARETWRRTGQARCGAVGVRGPDFRGRSPQVFVDRLLMASRRYAIDRHTCDRSTSRRDPARKDPLDEVRSVGSGREVPDPGVPDREVSDPGVPTGRYPTLGRCPAPAGVSNPEACPTWGRPAPAGAPGPGVSCPGDARTGSVQPGVPSPAGPSPGEVQPGLSVRDIRPERIRPAGPGRRDSAEGTSVGEIQSDESRADWIPVGGRRYAIDRSQAVRRLYAIGRTQVARRLYAINPDTLG